MENGDFFLHEYVFAKARGYRPWPAQVSQFLFNLDKISEFQKFQIIHIDKEEFTVLFFGSNDIMNVKAKDLESFNDITCKKQMKMKGKNFQMFRKAIREVQDRIDKFGVDTTIDGTELFPLYPVASKDEPTESRSVVITYQ